MFIIGKIQETVKRMMCGHFKRKRKQVWWLMPEIPAMETEAGGLQAPCQPELHSKTLSPN
jgi:hypothetical protein